MLTSRNRSSRIYFCLLFTLAYSQETKPNEECDVTKCEGLLGFYEELKCKPVFAIPGDCCPARYDCSHLSIRDPSKHCYANGREYTVGEELRDEDNLSPCSNGCKCEKSGTFSCDRTIIRFPELPRPGCYHRLPFTCNLTMTIICPKDGEERAKCEVDGKTYLDGKYFHPKARLDLTCICLPGFKGELVRPFCWVRKCPLEQHYYPLIHKKCAPVFDKDVPSGTFRCPSGFKCENKDDEIISQINKSTSSITKTISDNLKCEYGKQLLNIGDKVKYRDIPKKRCIVCKCNVPPTLECTQLTDSECVSL